MKTPKPLIPDNVRALYEELIDEGGRVIGDDDDLRHDPRLRVLLAAGLAMKNPEQPRNVVPLAPDAVFAQLLARWQRTVQDRRRAKNETERVAVQLHATAVRQAAVRRRGHGCILIVPKGHVTGVHTALTASAEALSREFITIFPKIQTSSYTADVHEYFPTSSSYVATRTPCSRDTRTARRFASSKRNCR